MHCALRTGFSWCEALGPAYVGYYVTMWKTVSHNDRNYYRSLCCGVVDRQNEIDTQRGRRAIITCAM